CPYLGLGYGLGYYSGYYGLSPNYSPGYATYGDTYNYYLPEDTYGSAAAPATYDVPPVPEPPVAQHTAQVHMYVPPDAKIWVQDQPTTQTGPSRDFQSPELIPGKCSPYHSRAQWREGDHAVTQSQQVVVHAGDLVNVYFPAAGK